MCYYINDRLEIAFEDLFEPDDPFSSKDCLALSDGAYFSKVATRRFEHELLVGARMVSEKEAKEYANNHLEQSDRWLDETKSEYAVLDMERTAKFVHHGQFRKDGKTPYIEHPRAVVGLLESWGFTKRHDGRVLAVAWGHDLLEESPPDKKEWVKRAIWNCSLKTGRKSEVDIFDAIRLLTWDKGTFPVKADYIRHVAETASLPVLAVKIADRICNTRDFLALPGAGIKKARDYFMSGQPLFDYLGKSVRPSDQLPYSIEEKIKGEINAVRKKLFEIESA
jgi:(p)ppGpp synthase/HD superfamily hydrolase